ncbi:MAG: hypothetical protein GEU28_15255, partial [Dehalococcoidia bacterium]|nr:hypothetical protein [Dehalococcoidia bacterium]
MLGEELRKAVAENPRLTPLGAEHLLQTNRLILRPGEAWTDPPAGQFQFWVARDEIGLPEAPQLIGASALLGYTESLQALISEAKAAEVPLHLDNDTLHLLPDGSVHLRRPGIDVHKEDDAERDALDYLKSKQLTRDVRPLVSRASSLEDLRVSLERLQALANAETAAPAGMDGRRGGRLRLAGAGLLMAAVVAVVAVAAVFLMQGDDTAPPDDNVIVPPPPTQVPPPPVAAACLALEFPVSLDVAQAACIQGTALRFDPNCPTGTACKSDILDGIVSVAVNDRTVAFLEADGKLSLGRENGQDAVPLSRGDNVQEADWSPDGAYLAYVTTQPTDGQTPGGDDAISTQLRIVEPGRPANDGIVLSTNNLDERTPDGLQRLISSPQWSPDGRLLYFLWSLPNTPGGEVFAVEVPRNATGDIEFGRLRSGTLADETRIDFPLTSFTLTGAGFGVTSGYISGLQVADDGTLLVQVCRGTGASRSCGIGRWDGSATLLLAPETGVVYGLPVASPFDGALHFPVLEGGVWTLYRLEGADLIRVPAIEFPEATANSPPVFSFNRKGDALLIETAPGQLSLVDYGTGTETAWGPGGSPAWFISKVMPADAPAVPTPPAVTYSTPSATAIPTATATPPPPLQMTLLITVRRNGNSVSGARVAAEVNGVECATVITTAGATAMNFPALGSPGGCHQTGATIRFVVDGVQLATPIATYMPQSSLPYDLNLPN